MANPAEPPVKFTQVLVDELRVVAERRERLRTERGDLSSTDLKPEAAHAAAWQARLLGLAFSGGGIRSATFNLGVLQALARCGVLGYVDYLSTVSGGGYIGSWLTALGQRRFAGSSPAQHGAEAASATADQLPFNASGYAAFQRRIAWSAGDGADQAPGREDRAIRFLREFSNYLTPKLGLFSGDTWALFSIYARNALLNQLVLVFAVVSLLLAPRLISPLIDAATPSGLGNEASGALSAATKLLLWLIAVAVVHLFVCWKVGKNMAGVTLKKYAEATPKVILFIGVPLLMVGISAASWLGHFDTWLTSALVGAGEVDAPPLDAGLLGPALAAIAGALVSTYTWVLAGLSARLHRTQEKWSTAEKRFWRRMIGYAPVSGVVFGLLLYGSAPLFSADVYSGYRLIAGPPVVALAVLAAGVLHVGLAGKALSSQYTEWLSRFGGLVLIGALAWAGVNALVFLGPLVATWLRGTAQTVVSSGWLLTTLTSVIFGRQLAASSSRRLPKLFIHVAPWIFIIGLGLGMSAALQGALHFATTQYGTTAEAASDGNSYRLFGLPYEDGADAERKRDAVRGRIEPPPESDVFGRIEFGGSSVEVRGRVADPAAAAARGAALEDSAAPEEAGASPGLSRLLEDYGTWLEATENPLLVLTFIALAVALGLFLSWHIDINVFSLHGMYANRLVRCYLGASVEQRTANTFSGLSGRDDLCLHAVPRAVDDRNLLVHPMADGGLPGAAPLADQPVTYPGPYHLVNTAINLVAGGNLAYQERKAGAFLLSPLYCGFTLEGSSSAATGHVDSYRPSTGFSCDPKPLTLGEAIATSGAAASPNMGYHSTAAFAFLMGVFNIRLGRWVGNPHEAASGKKWRASGPRMALWHLMKEALGLTDSSSAFVYLSDGGHFENLGVYELVRRRCRYVIVCDSGADAAYGFEDLANAIRKCRTDLGVEIDLDVRQIAEIDANGMNGAPCAVGQIRYSDSEVGTILYIKPSRLHGLPSDVMHYAAENPAFPHESTADQFFSESQFESYRRLGHHLASQILASTRAISPGGVDVDQLFRDLGETWHRPSRSVAAHFGRLGDAVDELFERLRTSRELAFLSKQFYPEWRSLFGDAGLDANAQADDLVELPKDEEVLRQGFYFCASLIRLMESVYIDLNLETEWQHPDNSGWLNLFNHWAWSGMFRATWAVSAATYGRRFRAFCEKRLNLELGVVVVDEPVYSGAMSQLDLRSSGLNLHERQQIHDLPLSSEATINVYRLELRVPDPIRRSAPALMRFGFGYAVMVGEDLVMYRVQDHLRGMGLGRKGLLALVEKRSSALGLDGLPAKSIREFFARYNEQVDRGRIADFRAMVISVNEQWSERQTAGARGAQIEQDS